MCFSSGFSRKPRPTVSLKVHKAQRLDSTHVLGLVSQMSRLEGVRESLRLAPARPAAWPVWWERYAESRPDYQAPREALAERMLQAGRDARDRLGWTETLPKALCQTRQWKTLRQVFGEHFELTPESIQRPAQPPGAVHHPHDSEAQWSSKSTMAAQDKSSVGYKTQVSETVPTADDPPGAPTDAVITAVVTQPAIGSDKAALPAVEGEWVRVHLPKPEALDVDAGYTSGRELARAEVEGRELIGPVPPAPKRAEPYSAEAFEENIRDRVAVCPAGQPSSPCRRLEEESTSQVSYRFEWNHQRCGVCFLRKRCVGWNQSHRTLLVGEYHEWIQRRRRAMAEPGFKVRMHPRNGIEGSISELKRGYGLGRSRVRGLAKTSLQNDLLAAACPLKRWARRMAWEIERGRPICDGEAPAWTA